MRLSCLCSHSGLCARLPLSRTQKVALPRPLDATGGDSDLNALLRRVSLLMGDIEGQARVWNTGALLRNRPEPLPEEDSTATTVW